MKKLILSSVLALMTIFASAQYRYASGPIVGSMLGGTYKMYASNHIVLQTDLFVGLHYVPGMLYQNNIHTSDFTKNYWDIAFNPNLMYQAPIAEVNVGWLNYFLGAGATIGIAPIKADMYYYGKAGANVIAGIEYVFEGLPLALSIDVRPGYGFLWGEPSGVRTQMHTFDWGAGLALRFYVNQPR